MKVFNIGYDFDLREFTVTEVKENAAHPLPPMESFKSFSDAQAFSAMMSDEHRVLRFEYYTQAEVEANEQKQQAEMMASLLADATIIDLGQEH